MKKILLGFGTFAAISTPVVVAVSCDSEGNVNPDGTVNLAYSDEIVKTAVTFAGHEGSGVSVISELPNAVIEVSPSVGLRNGDVVNITITSNEGFTLDSQLNTTNVVTKTVDGLTTPQTIVQTTQESPTPSQQDLDSIAEINKLLPAGSTIVPAHMFQDKVIPVGYTLPSSITTIETGAFEGASLPEGFTLNEGITTIKAQAFENAKGYGVVDGNMVYLTKHKEADAYRDPEHPSDLPNVWEGNTESHWLWEVNYMPDSFTLPSSLRTVETGAFFGLDFSDNSHFQIPDTITSIRPNAFGSTLFSKNFINKNPNNHPGWSWSMYGGSNILMGNRGLGVNESNPFKGNVMKETKIAYTGKDGQQFIGYSYVVIEFLEFTETARTQTQLNQYIIDGGAEVDPEFKAGLQG